MLRRMPPPGVKVREGSELWHPNQEKAESKTTAAMSKETTDAAAPPKADPGEIPAPQADGMMAGVSPGVKTADDEKKKMLPVTTFGRYVKVLLSSNEFLFVN